MVDFRWIALLVMVLFVLLASGWIVRTRRHFGLLDGAPTSTTALIAGQLPTLAVVRGVCRPGPAGSLVSPLSGKPCVWWCVVMQHSYRNSRGAIVWRTFFTGGPGAPFTLVDETGAVLVDERLPRHELVEATALDVHRATIGAMGATGEDRHLAPAAADVLERAGQHQPARYVREGADYRFTEYLLPPGTPLTVLGRAQRHGDTVLLARTTTGEGGTTKLAPERLRTQLRESRSVSTTLAVLAIVVSVGMAVLILAR